MELFFRLLTDKSVKWLWEDGVEQFMRKDIQEKKRLLSGWLKSQQPACTVQGFVCPSRVSLYQLSRLPGLSIDKLYLYKGHCNTQAEECYQKVQAVHISLTEEKTAHGFKKPRSEQHK